MNMFKSGLGGKQNISKYEKTRRDETGGLKDGINSTLHLFPRVTSIGLHLQVITYGISWPMLTRSKWDKDDNGRSSEPTSCLSPLVLHSCTGNYSLPGGDVLQVVFCFLEMSSTTILSYWIIG